MESEAEALERYLAGEPVDDQSGASVNSGNPDVSTRWDIARQILRAGVPDPAQWNTPAMLEHVLAEVRGSSHLRSQTQKSSRSILGRTRTLPWWHARRFGAIGAAALIGIAAFGISRGAFHKLVAKNDFEVSRTHRTGIGQQAQVMFADGTRAMLAPQSVLRVLRYDGSARTIELEGEAYFDIPRSTDVPFTVRTGGVSTRVLGTSFFVRRYASDPAARVVVSSGRVSMAPAQCASCAITVSVGGVAVVADSGVLTADADVARYTEWMNGELVFRRASARDVVTTLSRWYGYEFRFADPSIAADELTVGVSTRSSSDALATIKMYLDVDLAFNGNVVTLSRHRRSSGATRRGADTLTSPFNEVGR